MSESDTPALGQPDSPPANAGRSSAASARAGLLARLGHWRAHGYRPRLAEAKTLFSARLTDVAANRLAQAWCERYRAADDKDRRLLLTSLVTAYATLKPVTDQATRFFRRLNMQVDHLHFLVNLRADMLRWRNQIAGLTVLERELGTLLSSWFDVGMLELRPITWDSPASLLEKLIQYEAVHEIQSWDALRHRVTSRRRCYAFFHPRMADVPLIFVEVAFAQHMAGDVQILLDPQALLDEVGKARWAIFYSISNTQAGLRGISFGNFLLKRVIDQLLMELPHLKFFATLSPVPGLVDWLSRQDRKTLYPLLHGRTDKSRVLDDPRAGLKWVKRLQRAAASGQSSKIYEQVGCKLAAHYLTTMKGGRLIDPVARFHLGNGARMERLNWGADCSPKGLAQSCSIMVNYLYDLNQLDANLAALIAGKPRLGRKLR